MKFLVVILVLLFSCSVLMKAQDIVEDSLVKDEKTTLLPEVVVHGHPHIKLSQFMPQKMDMQLSGVTQSDMSFKPLGFLQPIFKLLFKGKRKHKESSSEKNQRILREYDYYLPPKDTKAP